MTTEAVKNRNCCDFEGAIKPIALGPVKGTVIWTSLPIPWLSISASC